MPKWIDDLSLPAGFVGLLLVAGAIAYYFLESDFGWTVGVLAALGLLLLGLFIYGNSVAIRRRVGARQLRYGTNAVVMVAALFGVLTLVNLFLVRNTVRWDLTAAGEFTLSSQSLRALENVKEPVKVIGFFSTGDASEQKAKDLLKQYANKSDKISYEFVDPDVKPTEVLKYGLGGPGTLVFLRGARRQDATSLDESSITSAIIRVTADKPIKVAFLTGHGEKSLDIADNSGYRQVKVLLEQNNYQLDTINLTTSPTLTTDYALVVVAGPRSSLLEKEKEAMKGYLDAGGRLLVMGDPRLDTDVNELISKWGVEIGAGVVLDPRMAAAGDMGIVVVQNYLWSAVTKDMNGLQTLFPYATNVTKKVPAPAGIWYDTLLESSDAGWVEMDKETPRFDAGVDIKGPVSMGVAVTDQASPEPGSQPSAVTKDRPRLVVFGDSDFVANGFIGMGANADLFLNAVNWLAQSEQEIQIKPKPPIQRSMTLSNGQKNFMLVTTVGLLPFMVLVVAGVVGWRTGSFSPLAPLRLLARLFRRTPWSGGS
ncbi:MAG: GldG family protein [Chloroflexi bacterium]|nr:GldG family protein [Chloroflexota bacterium]